MRQGGNTCRAWRQITVAIAVVASVFAAKAANAEPIFGITVGNQLIRFDSATPGSVGVIGLVTGLGTGEQVLGIDFRPATGQLFGLGSLSRLYTIDTTTAGAAQVGASGAFTLTGIGFGFDFNPTVDRIRVTNASDQNLRINPDDGTLTATDGMLAFAATDANAGADPTVTGSAYANNFAGATSTTLYNIDSNLDILVTQVPPNAGTLNTVGPLGVNANNLLGFDISGVSGTAFASFNGTGVLSQLYTINLATGSATLVGNIGSTDLVRGIAAAPAAIPEPGSLVLFGTGLLAFLGRRRRRTLEPRGAPAELPSADE